MVLLVLLAVGMLQLASISLRGSTADDARMAAQANARLALMLAIADLQQYAGPDQRVTASADLLRVPDSEDEPGEEIKEEINGQWTGVWSTTLDDDPSKPMVAGHGQADGDIPHFLDLRSTDPTWRDRQFRAWLVSGENPQPSEPSEPSEDDSSEPSEVVSIELVGPGTLGTEEKERVKKERVTVPYVKIHNGVRPTGGYAWWVGDESLKARIDLSSPHENSAPNRANPGGSGMLLLAGAALPGLRHLEAPDGSKPYAPIADLNPGERAKLLSLATVGLAVNHASAPRGFHHVTTHSKGLLVDVTTGSLKKDLTAFLERPGGAPAVSGIPGTGLAPGTPMLPSERYRRSGPNFAHLKNWHDLRDRVTGGYGDARVANPPFMAMRAGISGSYFNMNAPLPDVTQASQPLQPVLTDFRIAFDFSHDPNPDRAGGKGIYCHLYPRVTLWNPYNVTLPGQTYYVGLAFAYLNHLRIAGQPLDNVPLTDGLLLPGLQTPASHHNIMTYFMLAPVDLGPGESLVFSPDVVASGGQRLSMNSVQYLPGNIERNVLSATVPGGTNNFHILTNRMVHNSVTLDTLSTRPNYHFASEGSNPSYSPTIMLKRLRSGGSNVTLGTLNSNSAETLQAVVCSANGITRAPYWNAFDSAMISWNGGEGFQDYSLNPNRFPPRVWAVQVRTRWLDESDLGASFSSGFRSGIDGRRAFIFDNALIGNFNVRAPYTFRNPMGYYRGHDWTIAPGAYAIPWPTLRLNDPRMSMPYRDGKAQGSPFSGPNEIPGPFAMFDVPRPGMPIFSLASFQHAQLGYHTWQPTYVIGHSLAEPSAERDASVNAIYRDGLVQAWGGRLSGAASGNAGNWPGLIQSLQQEVLVHDISFAANQRLWDRYFLSTIPYNEGSVQWNPETEPLPNPNLKPVFGRLDKADADLLTGQTSFDHASAFLANYGAFNVNSTSVEAWRAMLSSLNSIPRPTLSDGAMHDTFSRLLVPVSGHQPTSRTAAGTWNGARTLTAEEINVLARTMVDVVRERGPFLSMADFVNRRLGMEGRNDMNDPTLCGPLQAAIERSGINRALQDASDVDLTVYDTATNPVTIHPQNGRIHSDMLAYSPFKNYGAPGYLTQADILQSLGHRLTVRGDTFVIRTYGDARDASGRVIARAWCEALVQRTPEYLVSQPLGTEGGAAGNNPLDPAAIPNVSDFNQTANPNLLENEINSKHGRRFVIESFRWLSPEEI